MSDYRIKITIQNANILRAMKKKGVKSVSELCRLTNTGQSTIGDILNLKKSPVLLNGDWNSSVLKICEFLNVMPSVLFSDEQRLPLEKNTGYMEVSFEDISQLISDKATNPIILQNKKDKVKAVEDALSILTEREQKILNLKFGIDGAEHTLEEIGELFGISKERVRQIENKSLRKLRYPKVADKLREFIH